MADIDCGDSEQRISSGSSIGDTANEALQKAGDNFLQAQTDLDNWANQQTCSQAPNDPCDKGITKADKTPVLTHQPGDEYTFTYRGQTIHIKITWYEASWTVSRTVTCTHQPSKKFAEDFMKLLQGWDKEIKDKDK